MAMFSDGFPAGAASHHDGGQVAGMPGQPAAAVTSTTQRLIPSHNTAFSYLLFSSILL